jgi:hypothetical protein
LPFALAKAALHAGEIESCFAFMHAVSRALLPISPRHSFIASGVHAVTSAGVMMSAALTGRTSRTNPANHSRPRMVNSSSAG